MRRLRSFGVQRTLLQTLYDTVVASALLNEVVCWGGSSTDRDRKRLNKLVRMDSSVLDWPLDWMLAKLASVVDSTSHRLHRTVEALSSSFSSRLLHPLCKKECYCRSFIPRAITRFNSSTTWSIHLSTHYFDFFVNILLFFFFSIYVYLTVCIFVWFFFCTVASWAFVSSRDK